MKTARKKHINSWKHQRGVTLIELLIAGVISLIAVSGMLLVMATTLGTSTQTIEMSRLSQEMRTAMQILTRELRRANYHSGFLACYGHTDCLDTKIDGTEIKTKVKQVQIGNSVGTDDDCIWFWYDRPQNCPTSSCTTVQLADAQIAVTAESVAAFRRTVSDGVGIIQMTTTRTSDSDPCNASADDDDWKDITDPNIINVESFIVSKSESITETLNTAGTKQYVDKIGLTITAKLTADASVPAWIQGNANATRELNDFVKVRNNTIVP